MMWIGEVMSYWS